MNHALNALISSTILFTAAAAFATPPALPPTPATVPTPPPVAAPAATPAAVPITATQPVPVAQQPVATDAQAFNRPKTLSREKYLSQAAKRFDELDVNKDGVLSTEEIKNQKPVKKQSRNPRAKQQGEEEF